MQSWVNLAGTLELHKISDEYLRILSINCVSQTCEEFTPFNLLCTKVLFNVALCLGSKLFIMCALLKSLIEFILYPIELTKTFLERAHGI